MADSPVISFQDAVNERYLNIGKAEEHRLRGGKLAEMVGMSKIHKKQSNLENLRVATLTDCGISCIGSLCECTSLEILTLARNPLPTGWEAVRDLLCGLPDLVSLDLSDVPSLAVDPSNAADIIPHLTVRTAAPDTNPCTPVAPIPTTDVPATPLKRLVLNNTTVSYGALAAAAPHKPWLANLSELHLAGNACALTAAPPSAPFPHLTLLDLSNNNISSFAALRAIAALPLETLNLSRNPLDDAVRALFGPLTDDEAAAIAARRCGAALVEAAGAGAADAADATASSAGATGPLGAGTPPPLSRTLRSLVLDNTPVASVALLDELAALTERVTALRVADTPLLAAAGKGQSYARMAVIARLPLLELLNGAAVRGIERKDAEREYLSDAGAAMHAAAVVSTSDDCSDVPAEWHAAWPRLREYAARHGNPVAAAAAHASRAAAEGSASMGTKVLTLTLISEVEGHSADALTGVNITVPSSLSVQRLRLLAGAKFGRVPALESSVMDAIIPGDRTALPFVMSLTDDTRELGFYGITPGATIKLRAP